MNIRLTTQQAQFLLEAIEYSLTQLKHHSQEDDRKQRITALEAIKADLLS